MSLLKTKDAVCILGPFLKLNYCAMTEKATLQSLRVRECVVFENKSC